MSIIEILLLIIGAIVFIASFVVPVKQEELKEETKQLAASEVKELVQNETEAVRVKIDDLADDTITSAMEKAERSMERISNEKIMAVNEYSDTVLDEIHKNHQEVVFLYDMLTDKQSALKKEVQDADTSVKKLLQDLKDQEATSTQQLEDSKRVQKTENVSKQVDGGSETELELQQSVVENDTSEDSFEVLKPQKVSATRKTTKKTPIKEAEKEPSKTVKSTTRGRKAITVNTDAEKVGDVQLQLSAPKKEHGINSNERILELHTAGKSNMAIAKELGLGVGEVKLVIDLYEGLK